jgi:hypothetical protein
MDELTPPLPGLSPVLDKDIVARFDGESISSDGGLLVLREVQRRSGLPARLAACLDEATNRRTRLQCRQRELAAADDPEEPDMMERALSSKDAGTEAKPAQAQPAAAEEDARQDPVDGFFNGVTGIFK